MEALWRKLLAAAETFGAIVLLALAVVFAVDVSLRYALGVTASWIVDLEWYLAAAAICASFAPSLAADAHVRVDVFWTCLSKTQRRALLKFGHLCLLLPWCAFVAYAATRYTYNSYLIGEGSPDPGGLPYRWAAKALVPLAFLMLFVQGLRELLRPAQTGTP